MKPKTLSILGGAAIGAVVGGVPGAVAGGAVAALAYNAIAPPPRPTGCLVPGLVATADGPRIVRPDDSSVPAHWRQGELDGACGIYSVAMALQLVGAIPSLDALFNGAPPDGRTLHGRFMNLLNRFQYDHAGVLFQHGTDEEQWAELVDVYRRHVNCDLDAAGGATTRRWLTHHAVGYDQDCPPRPVVIAIAGHRMAHATLVVGAEWASEARDEPPTKLRLLDPGDAAVSGKAWTTELDLRPRKGRFPYTYRSLATDTQQQVALQSAMAIWPNSQAR